MLAEPSDLLEQPGLGPEGAQSLRGMWSASARSHLDATTIRVLVVRYVVSRWSGDVDHLDDGFAGTSK